MSKINLHFDFSPVTDFKEASCRQYELGEVRHSFCTVYFDGIYFSV
jgi:hypothetical protein